jgi:TetR/AcrR family transcriptional regulator
MRTIKAPASIRWDCHHYEQGAALTASTEADTFPEPVKGQPEAKERLLESAIEEFATHGYAGARVERIAARADSNVASLYRFFGKKDSLYRAVLDQITAAGLQMNADAPQPLGERLVYYSRMITAERWRQALRIYAWADLEGIAGALRHGVHPEVANMKRDQEEHALSPDLDADLVYLLTAAFIVMPQMMPMWTGSMVGMATDTPEFRERVQRFLRALALHLGEGTAGAEERVATR